MTSAGAVAIFALDIRVRGTVVGLHVVFVALCARCFAEVLDRKRLPLADIALAIETVSEVPAVDAEIIGYHEQSRSKNQDNQANRHPQRVKNMSFHLQSPWHDCATVSPDSGYFNIDYSLSGSTL